LRCLEGLLERCRLLPLGGKVSFHLPKLLLVTLPHTLRVLTEQAEVFAFFRESLSLLRKIGFQLISRCLAGLPELLLTSQLPLHCLQPRFVSHRQRYIRVFETSVILAKFGEGLALRGELCFQLLPRCFACLKPLPLGSQVILHLPELRLTNPRSSFPEHTELLANLRQRVFQLSLGRRARLRGRRRLLPLGGQRVPQRPDPFRLSLLPCGNPLS
ncbi:unnamed protein product, partial [Ectocarpus fasciculatus]